ncbi:MAG: ROK family transcriptional regulator [bacterium]
MSAPSYQSLLQSGYVDSPSGRIIRALSERGSLSAAQIARSTGLARSTVSTAVAALRKSGLIMDAESPDEPSARQIGRPGTALRLNPEAGTCIGVHIASEELRVAVADVSHSVITEQTIPMRRDFSPEEAASRLQQFIASTYAENGLRRSGLLGVGVSLSAPVSPDGTVHRSSVVPSWAGVNVVEIFGEALGAPVLVNNESNCSAIAESMWGAAQGEDDFVLFKLNVGVGGAIVVNGQVRVGIAGGAGEFGHVSIDPEGELCRCGNRGCLELKVGFAAPLRDLSLVHGHRITIDAAVALAVAGDVGATRLIADSGERAGTALALLGNILNPPLFLISGALARSGPILMDPLRAAFEKHSLLKSRELDITQRTRIVLGALLDNDVVLGAVGLVLRHHGRIS